MRPVSPGKLVRREKGETSAEVAGRILKAREIQKVRFAGEEISTNAEMSSRQTEKFCPLSPECQRVLERIIDRMGLSARAYDRIVKVARTIADLAGEKNIQAAHIAEAIQLRNDRCLEV